MQLEVVHSTAYSVMEADMRLIQVMGSALPALVSDCDYSMLSRYKWKMGSNGYPTFGRLSMHSMVMGSPADGALVCDHANRDRLDNRRENLRWATRSQNLANSGPRCDSKTGYKGVFFVDEEGRDKPWLAKMRHHGVETYIGYFARACDAARAFDVALRVIHGDFAYTNFPSDEDFEKASLAEQPYQRDWVKPLHVRRHMQDQPKRRSLKHGTTYRGVYRTGNAVRGKPFMAYIRVDGDKEYLGRFDTAEQAAIAYDRRAREAHGADAVTNFAPVVLKIPNRSPRCGFEFNEKDAK